MSIESVTILSFLASFSSRLQSFPASGSFPVSWFFASGGQNIGASASASVLVMNIQGWFPLGLTSSTSLQSKDSQESSLVPQFESISFSTVSLLYVFLSHSYMTTGKTIALTIQTFVGKVMSLLFNTRFRFIIAFLPRSKFLLISCLSQCLQWLWSPRKENLSLSTFPPSICHKVMELDAMILVFWMLNFKPAFSLSSFAFIKRLFSST